MTDSSESLENVWDGLLSRRPDEVRRAFSTLTAEERHAVIAHLKRMASEAGWQPEQRLSAQSALQALEGIPGTN